MKILLALSVPFDAVVTKPIATRPGFICPSRFNVAPRRTGAIVVINALRLVFLMLGMKRKC